MRRMDAQATSSAGLALRCPSCQHGYLLPRQLLGSLGARITCPFCACAFDVSREGDVIATPTELPPPPAHPRVHVADADAAQLAIAGQVLDALEARLATRLRDAAATGQLFATHGPELLAAYEDFRRRAGVDAGAQAFRETLRERTGVELFPLAETRG